MKNTTEQKAQTAIELAVFGAILIFVLGMIIRSGIGAGMQQHATLKATRMAMKTSYEYSEGLIGGGNTASRNNVTLLFVEDRLTSGSDKYGPIDRVPMMTMGTATHSRQLFMPIDFGDSDDLPVFDVFVNGQRFVFSTAAFRTFQLARSCRGAAGCPAECKGDCSADSPQNYPGVNLDPAQWEDNCVGREITYPCTDLDCSAVCADAPLCDNLPAVPRTFTTEIGCPKLYITVENYPLAQNWCDDLTPPTACPVTCGNPPVAGCNLAVEDRFDLDRDGTTDVLGGVREWFAWQWRLVAGWHKPRPVLRFAIFGADPTGPTSTFTLHMAEGITMEDSTCQRQCEKAKNIALDFDGDLRVESIMPDTKVIDENGILQSVGVMDLQSGDVNSYDDDPPAGFTRDVHMFTFVRDASADGGTYFQVDEGKLFTGSGDTRQYIRTASKKDQIDLIQRIFQLSNDTGRYCLGGSPTNWAAVNNTTIDGFVYNDITLGERQAGLTNPVEACNSCFSSGNIKKTCMDTTHLLIFIRSRIKDLHGRKWVTDVSSDPSVDFQR